MEFHLKNVLLPHNQLGFCPFDLLLNLYQKSIFMKKSILVTLLLAAISGYSQEHFAGLTTSSRVGILNVGINPAELNNMSNRFEVNIFWRKF